MSQASVDSIATRPDGVVQFDRRPDTECRALASDFLTELIGSPPDALRWDTCHRLKGHMCIHDCELVVIAPRDAAHRPVVLTTLDWGEIRKASTEDRSALLGRYAIADRHRLAAMLARNDPVPTAA